MAMLRLSSSKLVHLSGNFFHTSAMALRAIRRENSQSLSIDSSSSDYKKQIDLKVTGILKSEIARKSEFDAWIQSLSGSKSDLTARNILAYLVHMPKSSEYPFKVRNITMTRDFDGERMDVVVSMDDDRTQSDSGSDGGSDGDHGGGGGHLNMEMTVTKENGKLLKIGMTTFNGEIEIKTVSFQEPAETLDDEPFATFDPYHVEENEEMQHGMREYVAARGLKDFGFLYGHNLEESTFLKDRMMKESNKLPLEALEKLRDFIED